VKAFFERIKRALEEQKEETVSLLFTNPTKEELSNLLKDRIGEDFSQSQLEEIYKEGEKRYKLKIPPGYSDAKKEVENKKYGDLIIWKQILEKAKRVDSAILFITGDKKEDWFLERLGKTIGPRPELVAEIKKIKNIPFYIYQTHKFLEYAYQYLSIRIKADAIKEVKEVQKEAQKEREANLYSKGLTFTLADLEKQAGINLAGIFSYPTLTLADLEKQAGINLARTFSYPTLTLADWGKQAGITPGEAISRYLSPLTHIHKTLQTEREAILKLAGITHKGDELGKEGEGEEKADAIEKKAGPAQD